MSALARSDWRAAHAWHEQGWWQDSAMPGLLSASARTNPDGLAVVDGAVRWTWAQWAGAAGRIASELSARGIDRGDVVLVHRPDGAATVAALLAVQAVEAVSVPLAPVTGSAEVAAIAERTRARGYFGPAAPEGVEHLELPDDLGAAGAPLPPPGYAPDPDAVSEIMFTSGTTGRPKGVMNSANTKLSGLRGLLSLTDLGPDDVWGVVAPLSHNAGWLYSLMPAIATGARTVFVPRGDPARMLETLRREGVTCTFLVPTHLLDLLAVDGGQDLALRLVITGAAAAPPGTVRAVVERWHATVLSMYGLTECQANLLTRPDDPVELVEVAVGRPCPGTEVAIRDPVGGALLAADEVGEVVTRGPTTFLGYYDDQAVTDAAFTKDGWFRTGDLGTADAGGNVRIVGRLKDVILRGGATVVPGDVEAAAATFPGIAEHVAVGVPDARLGERIVLCVEGAEAPSAEVLRTHLEAQGIGRVLWPDAVVAVPEFPRTTVGKVQRNVLVARLTGGS